MLRPSGLFSVEEVSRCQGSDPQLLTPCSNLIDNFEKKKKKIAGREKGHLLAKNMK